MPELPEVLTIIKDLQSEISSKVFQDIETSSEGYKRNFIHKDVLIGAKISTISNISKLIIINTNNKGILAIHLGMTGQLLLNNPDLYTKLIFHFKDNTKLFFSDIRMFGYAKTLNEQELNEIKQKVAPTIIDNDFDLGFFTNKLKRKKIPIKSSLLDQSIIGGVGNIYATDALFLSKINPLKPSNELTKEEIKNLTNNIKLIIEEGITHRGSSINRYVDLYGKKGTHQNYFRIYGKKNQNCPTCNNPLKFIKLSGRGTYYCPICQPIETPV